MRRLAFFSLVLLLALMGKAFAQNAEELHGLTHVGLAVEDLDEDAKRCGITKDLIRDSVAYTMSASKLKLSEDDWSAPLIYIRASAMVQRNPVQCISDVSVELMNMQKVQLNYMNGPPRFVTIQLWHDDWLEVSQPERHAEQVRRAVENATTKKFVAAWSRANAANLAP